MNRDVSSAHAALVATHGPRVWSLCRRLSRQPEDDYQAIWEKVFRAVDRVDTSRDLAPWITTLARRHLIDRHRRHKVRGEVVELHEVASTAPDPDRAAAAREGLSDLESALQRLPEAQRRVVVLHHVQGLPLERIAAEEGVALGTVKSRLHRGRAELVRRLGGHR